MVTAIRPDPAAPALEVAREVAASVPDPELPMVTLADLGILRDVTAEDGQLVVTITPTYSGCPALREIAQDLRHRLSQAGFAPVTVRTVLAPAWTSDWITPAGRRKLQAAGIAPPHPAPARDRQAPVPLILGTPAAPRPAPGPAGPGPPHPGHPPSPAGGVPAVRLPRHDPDRRVQCHRVQGPVPLRRLP